MPRQLLTGCTQTHRVCCAPIHTKWVFKLKCDTNGRVVRFKDRLVACGYAQKYGRDYRETYSPVASAASIRFVFALSAVQDMVLSQHDIETAFLYMGFCRKISASIYAFPKVDDLPPDCVLQCSTTRLSMVSNRRRGCSMNTCVQRSLCWGTSNP